MATIGKPLSGRVAVVTGCSRRHGIGYANVLRLIDLGAAVFAQGWRDHDRTQDLEDAPGVLRRSRSYGPRVRRPRTSRWSSERRRRRRS
jgi:NAD(P)-dependent dehydrogenase (short-subunit alcohol dehydrogenase family)